MSRPWRVVLDTNICVSALLKPDGLRAKVVQLAKAGGFRIISSVWIHDEIRDVFHRPSIRKALPKGLDPESWLDHVEVECATLLSDLDGPTITVDPKDDPILWAAYAGNADWVVSADADLLNHKHFHGAQIAGPKDFLNHWRRAR